MNVLCNLSPVGGGAHGTRVKTGVHRVADHLARGLAATASGENTIYFTASHNLWQAHRHFVGHLRGPHTRWALTPARVAFSRHLSGLEAFVAETVQNRALALRAARRAAVLYGGTWDRALSRVDDRLLARTNVYHSAFMPAPAWVKRHRHLRRFTTVYDLIPLTNPEFFAGDGVPRLLRAVVGGLGPEDWALCISEATREALLAYNQSLNPARVRVTHLAAGAAFHPVTDPAVLAAARARYGLPADAPYFLSVCTLERRKNLDAVIRGFTRFCRAEGSTRRKEVRLVLVGNLGWKTERIQTALEEAGEVRTQILQTGFVPDEDLAAIYSGARAFIYLSLAEGFGLPPLEAMQCGTPVVCSNVSSLPEIVGDAGVLLAPDDSDGLVTALKALLEDEGQRAAWSARGQAQAARFSWERFTAENLAAYRAALGS